MKISHFPRGILLFGLASCSPMTLEELRSQADLETKKLARELRKIETKEDLERSLPHLKKNFNRIADLLLQVKALPDAPPAEPTDESERLFIELSRIYEIPGGRELVERAQEEAVFKLSRPL